MNSDSSSLLLKVVEDIKLEVEQLNVFDYRRGENYNGGYIYPDQLILLEKVITIIQTKMSLFDQTLDIFKELQRMEGEISNEKVYTKGQAVLSKQHLFQYLNSIKYPNSESINNDEKSAIEEGLSQENLDNPEKLDDQNLSKSISETERKNFQANEGRQAWFNNNSVDNDDGSKYVGFLAREHGKFGSSCLIDDYGEESFP